MITITNSLKKYGAVKTAPFFFNQNLNQWWSEKS